MKMKTNKLGCPKKRKIDKLAKDALEVTEKIHRGLRNYEVQEKLELGLRRIEEDLNAIIMDNHYPL